MDIMSEDEYTKQEETDDTLITELRYAGFWMRLWAYLIDVIVIFSISGLFTSPLSLLDSFANFSLLGFGSAAAIISGLVYYSYFLIMTKLTGQTIGKMIFNLKVISKNTGRVSWFDLLFREVVGRFIYNTIFIMKLVYLVVAFTPKKQGIHDMIGNTYVVHLD
ncbi:MAG TPA: RDD family protein [Pseudogracilibacillus sp.]|nr:RDD family protein [Pseudogracilibacillus sp.]